MAKLLLKHTSYPSCLNRGVSLFFCFLFITFFTTIPFARAEQSTTLIRDTEIENTLKAWAKPVIEAADLSPDSVKIILVQSNDVNAFVAGGPNIFIFTGLIARSESPAEIVGVIAHELGHIRGGHLVRARGAMQNASYESLIGAVLGIGAAVLTGEGGLATAIVAGTQSSAMGRYLAFSRVQESSADQSALDSLEKAKINPQGLVNFMQKLEGQELLPAAQQNEYVRTHPLARDRLEALEAGLSRSTYKEALYPPSWNEEYARMKAKLAGFITPEKIDWQYEGRDHSIPADYARAIAAYRQNHTADALAKINALLTQEPDNPYFLELKGQMLVDFGRVAEALPVYKRSIEILPEAPLIRMAYAHAMIESAGEAESQKLGDAVSHLLRALKDEPRTPRIYRLLATAAGRLGQEPVAKLYLAEEALLKGDVPYAKRQAETALAGLKEGSNAWLRAKDILDFIEKAEKNR